MIQAQQWLLIQVSIQLHATRITYSFYWVSSLAGNKDSPVVGPPLDLLQFTHKGQDVGVSGWAAIFRPLGIVEDDYLARLYLLLWAEQVEICGGRQ